MGALSVPHSAISWSEASFMAMRGYFLATTALVSFGVVWHVFPGNAADMSTRFARPVASDPAVSAVNFKIDGFGGWMDATGGIPERNRDGGLGGSSASLTVPFGERYGLQLDGTGGSWGGNAFWSAGGHLFWRDPNYALLGVTGSLTRLDRGPWLFLGRGSGIDAGNFGGEGEYYMASTTLRGIAGWEGGDVPSRFFSKADLRWYPIMDLMLSVGYRFTGDRSALALSGEWLTPTSVFGGRASLFTEARVGESDFRAIVGGLRVYFGPSKTLIDKHRRDDPDNGVPDNLFASQAFSNTLDKNNKNATPAGTKAASSFAISDVRFKRDIVLLARLDNSIGLYRYRYNWSDTLYVGVMAQEVMAIVPDAVHLARDGFMRVDYGRLGLCLLTWDEWLRRPGTQVLAAAA
jgi:hypothetical protein